MKWEERGIFTRLYFIVSCLDSQNWKYYKLIGFNAENWFVNLGSLFIIGVFQLHYKILWYLWSMHAQKIKFSFVIWSFFFGFHKPALQEMSFTFMFCLLILGHVIILFYWRNDVSFNFPLIYMHICMYCTHNLQTVKLEILLRLGKQNMQAQDFYCRNHFGHHGR